MTKQITPKSLIERIAADAWLAPTLGIGSYQDCLRRGTTPRDWMLPGQYLAKILTPEELETLKELKPGDTVAGGNWLARFFDRKPDDLLKLTIEKEGSTYGNVPLPSKK